jgi:uncharacterized protein (UPF0335 family)
MTDDPRITKLIEIAEVSAKIGKIANEQIDLLFERIEKLEKEVTALRMELKTQ